MIENRSNSPTTQVHAYRKFEKLLHTPWHPIVSEKKITKKAYCIRLHEYADKIINAIKIDKSSTWKKAHIARSEYETKLKITVPQTLTIPYKNHQRYEWQM